MKITAVTCVKNEGPFLLEWIAFNRVQGVTDFLFYSNDCTDGTDALLDGLAGHGILTHLPNPAEDNRNYQMAALKHAREVPLVQNSDWIWVSDVDEFLNIKVGEGRFADLIKACGDPAAISVHFQMFANGGVQDYLDVPVIGQFFRSHDPDEFNGEKAIEVKTLFRRDLEEQIRFYGAHRPFLRMQVKEAPQWTDGSGQQVPDRFAFGVNKSRKRAFRAAGSRNFASLHHYTLRSLDSYLVKTDRGDVNREFRIFEDDYWRERNDASHFDDSVLRYLPRLTAEIEALKALPGIADLHDASVAAHKAKIAELMQADGYQQLRERLLMSEKAKGEGA